MKVEMGGTCSMHGRDEKCIHNFNWKTEGRRPHGRLRHRQEDIRMYLYLGEI